MFLLLIYCCFAEHVLDLTTNLNPQSVSLILHPLDTFVLRIPKGLGTFFSNWKSNKGLKLDVDAENLDGNVVTYRSFDNFIELRIIVFQTRDYFLKFFNDGDDVINLPLMFSKKFALDENDFYNFYSFTQHGQAGGLSDNFSILTSPFVISNAYVSNEWILLPLSVVFLYIIVYFVCKDYSCCKCFERHDEENKDE